MLLERIQHFLPLKMPIAAKTGTAQERTTDPDHATLISYAPYDNPQYCMAVRIQNGYASGNAVTLRFRDLQNAF